MSDNVMVMPLRLCDAHHRDVEDQLHAAGLTQAMEEARQAYQDSDDLTDLEGIDGPCDPFGRVAMSVSHVMLATLLDADEGRAHVLRLQDKPACPVCEMARLVTTMIPTAVNECLHHFEECHDHKRD